MNLASSFRRICTQLNCHLCVLYLDLTQNIDGSQPFYHLSDTVSCYLKLLKDVHAFRFPTRKPLFRPDLIVIEQTKNQRIKQEVVHKTRSHNSVNK